ncbi:MAG: hypothetical protein RBT37_08285 [Dissulfurispiraceae bacterium]|jgi:Cu/Ag efflux protein CusF|nr:hypothetical protein [Dissulfurispiraceae bacterium]
MKILMATVLSVLLFFIPAVLSAERIIIKHAIGEVLAIDVAAKSLTIKKKSISVEFFIDEATIVRTGKEKKNVSDIKIRDSVVVKYFVREGTKITKTIEIKQPRQISLAAVKPDKK